MENILIIDDDRRIRELLQEFLKNHEIHADTAENAERARVLMSEKDYSMLIVDVMMPGENGIDFTRKVKNEKNIPILMLTAMGEVEDRIKGLESGADDYLAKPFEPRELYLRTIKLLERSHIAARPVNTAEERKIIRFGGFEFDMENFILTRNGERIVLSSTESALLAEFCNNINNPIDRFELAKKFYGISERSVDVQVTRLRKKSEDDPKAPRYIQTSRGKGYVFRI